MPFNNKFILATIILVALSIVTFGQLQNNKPNSSSTIPQPTGILTPAGFTGIVPQNYVRTWNALKKFSTPEDLNSTNFWEVKQSTEYYDGLGRPLQQVLRQFTPGATPKDLVSPHYHDGYGRESYKFMPYVANATDGLMRTNAFVEQKAYLESQYANPAEHVFYAQINYEASPLNRVEKSMAAGNSWAGNNKGIEKKYLFNNSNDAVVIWNIGNTSLTYVNQDESTNIPYTSTGSYYLPGQLYKQVTLDESNKATIEYTNKEGLIILKKTQIGSIPADYSGYDGFLCTYFVYDDWNNLRFVMSPKAVEAIRPNWTLAGNTTVINELCFRYEYDAENRQVAKKVPGAGWNYMIYDSKDRLVFTQDANLRQKNQWITTLYDVLNRQVITGITTWSGTPAALQSQVTLQTAEVVAPPGTLADRTLTGSYTTAEIATNSITLDNGFIGSSGFSAEIISANTGNSAIEGLTISKNPIPAGATFIPLILNYFDNYSWTTKTFNSSYVSKLDAGIDGELNPNIDQTPTAASQLTTGLPTGVKSRVLKDPNNLAIDQWSTTVNFYDNDGRVIQSQTTSYKNDEDILTNLYDFSNQVICTYHVQTNPEVGATPLRTKTNYLYDHAGRLLKTWKTLNDEPAKTALVSVNEYDEFGRLKKQELGKHKDPGSGSYLAPIETLDYTYNVRGWLQGVNKDYIADAGTGNRWFGFELNYDWGFDTKYYNGMVAGTKWRSKGDGQKRSLGFNYDMMNRLLSADFAQSNGTNYVDNSMINFDVILGNTAQNLAAYDENGNIRALQQWGLKGLSSVQIDNLQYTYNNNSNKLKDVKELVSTIDHKLGDFTDKNTTGDDFGYDKNGNLITDLNKGITGSTGLDLSGGAIEYNHLNMPWRITIPGKGTITYTYDASGEKLQKKVEDISVASRKVTIITDYVSGVVYESRKTEATPAVNDPRDYVTRLQYFPHEEGRVRQVPAEGTTPAYFVYDYFIRDNLDNVRMVLTNEKKQFIYPAATLEGNIAADGLPNAVYKEKDYYGINSAYIVPKSAATGIPDYPNKNGGPGALDPPVNNNPNSDVAANSQKLYKLNASTNKTGLGVTLKVMAGDQIDIFGKSYWINTGGDISSKSPLPVTSLLDAFLGSPSMLGKGLTTAALNTTAFSDAATLFLNRADNPGYSAPWAYINWIFLDEQFNYAGGGADRVGASGSLKSHSNAGIPTLTAPKNGYIFVYCSNESNYDVFFDNLQVIHTTGPLVEETHYYPFGLTMAGISYKAVGRMPNKNKFNGGNELQSMEFEDGSGLEWYDAVNRMYDPQLGRFNQIDEISDGYWEWSPYSFGFNAPINFNDPLGLEGGRGRDRKYDKTSDGNTAEVLAPVYVRGRYSTKYLEAQYWFYRNKYDRDAKSDAFIKQAPKELRNWLYQYNQSQLFMEKVHEINRERDIIALDIASNFIPLGFVTKLKYLKYAKYLKVAKRGAATAGQYTRRGITVVRAFVEKSADELAKNTMKKVLAARGDLGQVDVNDIIVSTIAKSADAGIAAKWAVELWNATTDFTPRQGLTNSFAPKGEYSKDLGKTVVDLLYGHIKFGAKNYADSKGLGSAVKDNIDMVVDQVKAETPKKF